MKITLLFSCVLFCVSTQQWFSPPIPERFVVCLLLEIILGANSKNNVPVHLHARKEAFMPDVFLEVRCASTVR